MGPFSSEIPRICNFSQGSEKIFHLITLSFEMASLFSRLNILTTSRSANGFLKNNLHQARCFSAIQAPVSKPEGRTSCTLIPGDGVGPGLLYSVQEVFKAAGAPVDFEPLFLSEVQQLMSVPLEQVVESITRNGICLKGAVIIMLTSSLFV